MAVKFYLTLVVMTILSVIHVSVSIDPTGQMRLIEFNETYRTWMSLDKVEGKECGKEDQQYKHGGFMDVTDHPNLSARGLSDGVKQRLMAMAFPTKVHHEAEVNAFNSLLSLAELTKLDNALSAYATRKYNTDDGKKAAHYIRDKFVEYSAGRNDITVQLFEHTWVQPSVIARIEGSDPHADEIVIVGAHEDSIASTAAAPGADDDASGTSCVLEIFRVLASQGFKPERTIEFHTYSAEEVGLWGSQAIASYYQQNSVPVYAMIQLDMTMFSKQGLTPTIGIISDYVNTDLTSFLILLVNSYADIGYTVSKCGYGCSDHASWTKAGYAACFPFEAIMSNSNPSIHTKNDIFSNLDVEHGREFAKVAVGFLVELSLAN